MDLNLSKGTTATSAQQCWSQPTELILQRQKKSHSSERKWYLVLWGVNDANLSSIKKKLKYKLPVLCNTATTEAEGWQCFTLSSLCPHQFCSYFFPFFCTSFLTCTLSSRLCSILSVSLLLEKTEQSIHPEILHKGHWVTALQLYNICS